MSQKQENSNALSNPEEFYYRRRDITISLFLNFSTFMKIRVKISYYTGQIQVRYHDLKERSLFLKKMYTGNFCEKRHRIKATVNFNYR